MLPVKFQVCMMLPLRLSRTVAAGVPDPLQLPEMATPRWLLKLTTTERELPFELNVPVDTEAFAASDVVCTAFFRTPADSDPPKYAEPFVLR